MVLIRGFPPEFIVPDRIRPIGRGGLRKPSRIVGAARSESLCGLDVEKQASSDLLRELELLEQRALAELLKRLRPHRLSGKKLLIDDLLVRAVG